MHARTQQAGAAAVEFALALLVLLPLLAGLAGLGSAFYAEMALINGVRAGGQYAQVNLCAASSGCNLAAVVSNDIKVDLPQFATTGSVSINYAQACMDGSAPSNGSCPAQDSSGKPSDPTPWNFVNIGVSYSFPVLLAGLIPGLPATLSMSQSSYYRVN